MIRRWASSLVDRGWVPDPLLRYGIRRMLRARLGVEWERNDSDPSVRLLTWVERLRQQAISSEPAVANVQHYEVSARFFELVLGPRLKYSSCHWPEGVDSLTAAEESMLDLTVHRAGIADGQRILDLGCGWGSLTLWMAERFPNAEIVAVSNSRTQGDFIRRRAADLGLGNVEHVVADVGRLDPRSTRFAAGFDRVVSIEMFEHMRNYRALLEKIAGWLVDDGELFVHIFCHRQLTYPFEHRGEEDWMAHHFFRGGLMPAADLLPAFDEHLQVGKRWLLSGVHYQRTLEAWLRKLDRAREELEKLFASTYGVGQAQMWTERWRIFFMACSELFAYDSGEQWQVAHYRFKRT